jgi:hypothetical protein
MLLPIIATIFLVIADLKVWSKYRDHTLSLIESVLWSLLWLAIGVVFWQPEIASRLALFFGIGRGADLVVYVAIVVIVYLVFRLFVRLDKMDRQLTKLVRTIALQDEEKNRNTDSKL